MMVSLKHAALAIALASSAQASLYGESPVNHTCVLGELHSLPLSQPAS